MNPWTIDAREAISDLKDIDYKFIEINNLIKSFLNGSKHYFVVGSKGFGKSLLLLAKRKKLKNILMIPENSLLDVPIINLNVLSKEVISRLTKKENLVLIWSMSIVIAIIKRLNMFENIQDQCSNSLKKILTNKFSNTATSVFGNILTDINIREFYEELATDYNRILLPCVRSTKQDVAVFIDNIDECFEDYMELWYDAQNALIKAIYNLVRVNNKLKIYASIRKEAFSRNTSEMFLQYQGVSILLDYTSEELKNIFIQNIKKIQNDKLLLSNKKNDSPIEAFVGAKKIAHGIVDENEQMYEHILRHTLRRPRDLMEIGGSINNCNISERNPNMGKGRITLKNVINNSAANIAKSYIGEVLPHLTISYSDIEQLSLLINTNVIAKKKLRTICSKFNNNYNCEALLCKDCALKHIFCELYKVGLLGYVKQNDIKKDSKIQKFLLVGEKLFDEVGYLPSSNYYLIHPAFSEFIKEKNATFRSSRSTVNIIGYDRPWNAKKRNTQHEEPHRRLVFDVIDFLKKQEELDLSKYTVVGDYRRFKSETRGKLLSFSQKVLNSIESNNGKGRENYLIHAKPGSGKTFLIEEIAKSLGDDISFIVIDISKDSKDQIIESLNKIENEKKCLCLIDEIDGRSSEIWTYDKIYKKLDLNENTNSRNVVFTLIGSSGDSIDELRKTIESRYKGKDLVDRILNKPQYNIEIPTLELEDRICVYVSKIIDASTKNKIKITHIEKMALFYVAMCQLKSPRQLKIMADKAVSVVMEDTILRYDHHFNPGDEENKNFWQEYPSAVAKLSNEIIKIN